MVEWVDFQHINEHHAYQQINDEDHCWICFKDMNSHWFPVNDVTKTKDLWDEVDEVARKEWEK